MAVKQFLKSSGLAALAAGLAIAVLPAAASAEEWGRRDGRGEDRGQHEQRREGEGRSWQQRQQQPAPQAQAQVQVQQQAPRPQWNGGQGWNGGQRGDWQARSQQQPAPVQQARPAEQARGWNSGAPGDVRQAESRQGRSWEDRREREMRDQRHEEARRDDRWRGNDNWRSNDQWRGNDNWRSGDNRRWDRDWRRDNRYNWYGWRSNHRDVYRLGRYYPPYRNWSYRRLSIGFYLDNLFFSSNYWIDDPWSYRLPEAYGPYRWVRYYDDALMVDIYSGEVVDVIYDFFE